MIESVGVIGAGVMGQGVALTLGQYGFRVILIDLHESILDKAKQNMSEQFYGYSFINKNFNNENFIDNILFTTDYSLLKDVDFVVENIPEIMEEKKKVYEKISLICKKECIFCVNTSCISITEVASFSDRPEQVIGVHFMNPVPLISTVEAISGKKTTDETLEKTNDLIQKIGKRSIVINDSVGFVSNRISHLMMNEAAYLVSERVATPEQIDDIFRSCYGHKMGPLETADLIGLDTVMNSLQVLYDNYKNEKFRCCPLLKDMVSTNELGRKSGKGFYHYEV